MILYVQYIHMYDRYEEEWAANGFALLERIEVTYEYVHSMYVCMICMFVCMYVITHKGKIRI